jgi:hypothetical protein
LLFDQRSGLVANSIILLKNLTCVTGHKKCSARHPNNLSNLKIINNKNEQQQIKFVKEN